MLIFLVESNPNFIHNILNLYKFLKMQSIEFFPPKTDAGVGSLFKVLEKLKPYNPLFADFTWGAGGSTSDLTLDLCIQTIKAGVIPNMHLTCTNVDKEKIDETLSRCKAEGITNLLALRGDPPVGQDKWEASDLSFTCALDLVRYIRAEHGDFFNVTVAGYPEGHPTKMNVVEGGVSTLSPSELKRYSTSKDENGKEQILVCRDADYAAELAYLKEKVLAGADCIITQMFFDCEVFDIFVKDCRRIGITVPIVPGIMMISNLGGFRRMASFCNSRIPRPLEDRLAAVEASVANAESEEGAKELADKVKQFGTEFGIEMCKTLTTMGTPGLHFYTLNQSAATMAILQGLGYGGQ